MKRLTKSEVAVLIVVLILEGIGSYAFFHGPFLLAALILVSAKLLAVLLFALVRLRRNRDRQLHEDAMAAVMRHEQRKFQPNSETQ